MIPQYAEQVTRQVPGYHALQSMALILLEEGLLFEQRRNNSIDSSNKERNQDHAKILIVGAGGGMELFKFGTAHVDDWILVGVDPSADMLELARQRTDSLNNIVFFQGLVTDPDVPQGPYDGATCLLTLHFLPVSERLDTLQAIYGLLKPGAPLIVAHHSIEKNNAPVPTQSSSSSSSSSSTSIIINPWLQRYAAYTAAHSVNEQVSTEQALRGAQTIQERLPFLTPQQDEELLIQAGFHNLQLFYMAFTFRGWVAYKK
jgi:tRNA (cmo5U34)-methyltransferase